MKGGRKTYLVPQTTLARVQLEGTFAASGDEIQETQIEAGKHEAGDTFDVSTQDWG